MSQTTEYHYDQIDKKATNLEDHTEENPKFEIVSGPFGFKQANKLDKRSKQVMINTKICESSYIHKINFLIAFKYFYIA